MSNNDQSLSQETVFDLLSSARRRYILYYLRRHGGEATINELASEIASWENDAPVEELTSQDEKRVYVSLYQTHVPKLEEWGIVEYDGETGVVSLTDQAYQMDRYLTTQTEQEFAWQLYYLAIAVVSAVSFILVVLDVWLFSLVSPVVVGGATIALFAASAIAQVLLERSVREETPEELIVER